MNPTGCGKNVVEPNIGMNRLAALRLPPDDTSGQREFCDVFYEWWSCGVAGDFSVRIRFVVRILLFRIGWRL